MSDNRKSKSRLLPNGVPQGSPLSPLLFNLYTNDLPTNDGPDTLILSYADDIVLSTRDSNYEKAGKKLQSYIRCWNIGSHQIDWTFLRESRL